MYIKCIKTAAIKIFFSFFFFKIPKQRNLIDGNGLVKKTKKKIAILFQLESFVDKTTFNFSTHSSKLTILLLLNNLTIF